MKRERVWQERLRDGEKLSMSGRNVRCNNCIHYYITYDRSKPYGCRIMGFKSRISPAQVVYANSGIVCQLYTEKGPGSSSTDQE